MEQQPHQPHGGESTPAVNSYGTDDPETQAHIEHARVEAARERRRDRLTLDRLVELGLNANDAEVLIEFDHATKQAQADGERLRSTSLEDTRRDLADLLALRDRPEGATALAAFAADIRKEVGGARLTSVTPAAVTSYQAIGLDRRDALVVAGFEYYLRYKLASAGDPGASLGIEQGERPVRTAPRIYVTECSATGSDATHGHWIDANQSSEEIQADIADMRERSPTAGATEWTVMAAEGFDGLEVAGLSDCDLIAALGQGVAEHQAAFVAWVELHGTKDRDHLARFDDFYVGSYHSERDWAESVAFDLEWLEHLDRVVEPTLRPYVRIDYDKVARDTSGSWDLVTGADGRVYVFLR